MNNKIKCLQRYQEVTNGFYEIVDFLTTNRLMTPNENIDFKMSPQQPTYIYLLLERLKKENKLLALSYEWKILPLEMIEITIGIPSDYRVFSTNMI